jgi:hypothetical protein
MVLLDQKFAEALPLLFDFLGVADPQRPAPKLDPQARQRQLLGVLRQVVQSVSETRPTVTLIEDLHWLDAASEEFIAQMVDAREGSRNLLLLNFRPEYHADWTQKSWYRQIPLTPLGKEAIAELLADLLGSDPSIAALAGPIHARTGGNPFFTEEVAQTLIESGALEGKRGAYRLVTPIERLEVPATVHAVLAARIDRLPEREKRVLQVASVIGKDFAEPLLAEVAALPPDELKASLAELRRAEFLYERRSSRSSSTRSSIRSRRKSRWAASSRSAAATCTPRWRVRSNGSTPSTSKNARRCWHTTTRKLARRSAPHAGTGARPRGWSRPTCPLPRATGRACVACSASCPETGSPRSWASPRASRRSRWAGASAWASTRRARFSTRGWRSRARSATGLRRYD